MSIGPFDDCGEICACAPVAASASDAASDAARHPCQDFARRMPNPICDADT